MSNETLDGKHSASPATAPAGLAAGTPTISIAMATYNGAQFLQEQLESFVNQERRPDELVVTDDSSNDGTVKILDQFSKQAPFPVRVVRNPERLGYAANFGKALSLTRGDLVFLSDQDDVWFPTKISTIVDHAERYPDTLLFMADALLTDASLNEAGITKLQQFNSARLDMARFVMGCCCAIRRELLDLCLPVPPEYGAHDDWLVHFADGLGRRKVIDRPLQYYRRHGNNSSEFLANSLTPISRWTEVKRQLKAAVSDQRDAQFRRQISRQQLLVSGLARAEQRAGADLASDIASFRVQSERRLLWMRERQQVRSRSFPLRLVLALKLLMTGRYRASSGTKSFLKDVAG